MKYELLYQNLLNQLRKRIPQNTRLVKKMVDILPLEKDAVYRRLRQEVPFTFEEIVVIAKAFNLSLDSLLGVDARTAFPFRYLTDDKGNNVNFDYLLFEEYIQAIKEVTADSDGKISYITNLLPQAFFTGFDFIYRFYYFKWRYYSVPANQTESFHEINLPDQLIQIAKEIFIHSKNVKNNSFILDYKIFQDFVNDVIYFNNIRLLRNEDMVHIKDELFQLLDYMEAIATKGFVDNPSNEVFIYISDTSIETSYSFFDSHSSLRLVLIWSFIFNSILSFDEKTVDMMRRQIQSRIRTSTLLSVTGVKYRKLYFDAQRRIVDQL